MSEEYFEMLRDGLQKAYAIASEARSKGFDPSDDVEVKIAKDIAARVEGIVGPPNIANLIREMEKSGMARENIAFEIARKIAAGEVISSNKEYLIEQAVRTGVGILTEGVLIAPTEGIAKLKIKTNPDGSDYVAVYYAGPIRSAGGTAAALSLVLADIARKAAGVGDYRATDSQIERYIEEINMYEARVTHLQYMPPENDLRHILSNCPVCVDGEPTEEIEVSAFRGVPGVDTDRIRGGVPLVVCEGVAAKSAKLFKYTKKLKLGWDWLEKVIKIKRKADKIEIKPDPTYLEGLVAGRPVFSYPSRKGGFRLRYGRSRTTGLMAKNVHPATMVLLGGFIAYGTHMKIERPGKGCVISGHEGLEPPVVKLKDGRVLKVHTVEQAEKVNQEVAEILFIGDLLCTYGDFLKSNHPLLPSGYCIEWWKKELEAENLTVPESLTVIEAFQFSKTHNTPLHPDYTFPWHDISSEQIKSLAEWLATGNPKLENDEIRSLSLKNNETKRVLEELLVEHNVIDEHVILSGDNATTLLLTLGMLKDDKISLDNFNSIWSKDKDPLELVNTLSGIKIRAKAPTYLGARMGRPEKAKERKMDGSPSVLFPTGSFKNRSVSKIYRTLKNSGNEKSTNIEIARFRCTGCKSLSMYRKCGLCGAKANQEKICQKCDSVVTTDIHCDTKTLSYNKRPINIVNHFDDIKSRFGFVPSDVKGVKGLSNALRIPERLEKGFLRAKHDVYVFRDGTSRFDATDVTLSHFIPEEVGISLETVKQLGYEKDHLGNPITNEKQIIPLRHQDVILSEPAATYFMKVANFIDDMLMNLYGMKPFYNIKKKQDIIGHLCLGLSPHTSAAALCRIIGFTEANVGYGHPYFHTVKRRNCFYPSTEVVLYDKKNKSILRAELGELVEIALKNNSSKVKRLDDHTLRVPAPNNLYAFNLDIKSNKTKLKRIKYLIKSDPPRKWIKILTTTNREVVVTPDHNILHLEDGKYKVTTAENLKQGANIPLCLKLKYPKKSIEKLNLAKLLCGLSEKEKKKIMVRAKEFFKNLYYSNRERLLELLPKAFSDGSPNRWYSSVPLSDVEVLVKSRLFDLEDLPVSTKIAPKYDDLELPLKIRIDENLMVILGYYVSEGYSRKNKYCYQISFRVCDKQMRSKLILAIKKTLGKNPHLSENKTKIVICSKLLYLIFTKIFKCGSKAREKRVPNIIFNLSDDLVKSFISSYFDGDGSVVATPPRLYMYSVSKNLLNDIATLLLRFGILCRYGKSKPRLPGTKVLERYKELGKPPKLSAVGYISLYGMDIPKFAEICTPTIKRKFTRILELRKKPSRIHRSIRYNDSILPICSNGDITTDKVKKITNSSNKVSAYCIDIEGNSLKEKSILLNNQVFTIRCDGDEDCLMLLMDALINFSRNYLDEKRGGTMDAPLVLSTVVNPKEVDDEVHCMELVSSYPLDFYKAAENLTLPGDVNLKTVADVLGTPEQYESFPLTHPGGYTHKGVIRTTYVKLQSIPEKIETQFGLQEKLRAVDSANAAERLIMSHFIPDLYGNLRSYSRQTFRCVSCNTIYRRVPLIGKCAKCGGNLLLTINKGGIQKYLQIARDIAARYDLPDYLKQRLDLFEKELKSIFEDDKVKQMGLADFI